MRNVNSVVVIGNVGMTPEITEFGNGACVARCSLAVRGKKKAPGSMDGGFMDDSQQDSQEYDAQTTWLDVEAWNDEARQLVEHVAKGRQLQVTGRLKENSWIDKATGQKRSRIKVSAYAFAFIAPYAGPGAYGNVADPYAQNAATSYDDAPPAAAAAQSQNVASPATSAAPSAAAAPGAGGGRLCGATAWRTPTRGGTTARAKPSREATRGTLTSSTRSRRRRWRIESRRDTPA